MQLSVVAYNQFDPDPLIGNLYFLTETHLLSFMVTPGNIMFLCSLCM